MILALDQGTTSSRALVVSENGEVLAAAQQEFAQVYPHPAWVEHDPEAIWSSQLAVAHKAVAAVGAENIRAIGITNQRETAVIWDRRTGKPLSPAIVWQDRRTAARCEELRPYAAMIRAKTGLELDSYFSATKFEWLMQHLGQVDWRNIAFGTIDTFLLWRLTEGRSHVTDVSNASRTMLFNIHTLDWDDELLELFGIPRHVLPTVVGSAEWVGETTLFGPRLPITGMAGDQQAATFGQCCHSPGMAKSTYGTGCFLLMNIGDTVKESQHRLLSTVAWRTQEGTSYALEGSVFVAGAAVQWLRDELGIINAASETEALARSLPSNEGVYLVPAFVGLGAPHWNSSARGALVGLTRGSGRAHLARAALESIAYQCRDVLEAMALDCGSPLAELRVDGGAAANDFLLQFQADILGTPVVRPKVIETTAMGAAMLAGVGGGLWKQDELRCLWKADRTFEPQIPETQRENLYGGWKTAIQSTLSAEP